MNRKKSWFPEKQWKGPAHLRPGYVPPAATGNDSPMVEREPTYEPVPPGESSGGPSAGSPQLLSAQSKRKRQAHSIALRAQVKKKQG